MKTPLAYQYIKLSNVLGDTDSIPFESFLFSGGEWQIRFSPDSIAIGGEIIIEVSIVTSLDVMRLLITTDALRRINPYTPISVCMPYIPYARQDRVMVEGEALSIKVFADLINSQHYKNVYVLDPHSDVSKALINNLVLINIDDNVKNILADQWWGNLILVAPDAGALKKTFSVAKRNKITSVVCGFKERNVANGEITRTEIVYGNVDVKGATAVMIDDICDGGRTFVELAKRLKKDGASRVILIVSHGIFSKGFRPFVDLIDKIYSFNSPWSIMPEGRVESEYFKERVEIKRLTRFNVLGY